MEETYTFSRALYLMRYSGKRMKLITWGNTYIWYKKETNCLRTRGNRLVELESRELLGSWVEVK